MRKPLLFGIILTVCVVIVAFVFAQFYPEGMISYWKFDEGEGVIAYDSVDANDGTIFGATWTPGLVGDALSFDGGYGYVDCGNDPSLNPEIITISAWVKPTIINRWNHIVDKTGSHGQDSGYKFSITNGNEFRFRIRFMDDSMTALYSNTMAQANLWYHYVATYDQEQMRIYINGNLDNSIPEIKAIKHSSSSLVIGYNWWPSHTFCGTIDEVAIYNKALTACEIKQHYDNGLAGKGYTLEDTIETLIISIGGLDLPKGIEKSLTSKLDNALDSLERGRANAAKNQLEAFIHEVEALRGKKLTDDEADALIEAVQCIIDNI